MAGYELVTTAPDPGTAVFRSRGDRLASPTHEGSRHGPPRLRRRRNRWRVRRRVHVAGVRYRRTSGPGPGGSFPEPDSGHADTIGSTVRVRRASRRWPL